MPSLRQRLYQIFNTSDPTDPMTLVDNYLVPGLVAIDVAALILESFDELGQPYASSFRWIEIVVVGLFTLEYGLRLWCCVENPSYSDPLRGRWRYLSTSFALVDLAAILPFYALNLMPLDWAEMVGPFFRLLRLLKLTRYSESTQIFFRVLRDKRDELLTTLFVVMTLLVIASSLMYFIEREAQPEEFSSIPAAMWWGVITLTTVGYGDVYPITILGKFLSAILAFLGIGIFALPARDIATAFSEEMQQRSRTERSLGAQLPESHTLKPPLEQSLEQPLEQQVEAAAELMQLCVEAVQRRLGDRFEDEAIVRDLAIALFQATAQARQRGGEGDRSTPAPLSMPD